jgi:ribosomal protein S18 acetylase RimI-like enzyme
VSVLISRVHPATEEATALILELESHLARHYAAESRHGYSVEQLIAQDVAFFVLRDGGLAAGCGGIQLFGTEYGELKRMYVRPGFRGRGFGRRLLDHLAAYAWNNGVRLLRLETGIHQTEAIALYQGAGFHRIPPFGSYGEDPVSLCYEKAL